MTTVAPGPAAASAASGGGTSIRSLFSTRRPIDRPIEKVIDYYATDDRRLQSEIEEYEVTENVERNFRRFLDVFGHGVRTGQVTETGIWVAGFYGSGKSSFTKYLGFALDPARRIGDRPFLDLLAERINAPDVRQELKTLATQRRVGVSLRGSRPSNDTLDRAADRLQALLGVDVLPLEDASAGPCAPTSQPAWRTWPRSPPSSAS